METQTQNPQTVKVESNGRYDTVGQEQLKAVKSLPPFISTDETRPALKCFHVSEDGEFCEATNGHKLIRLPRMDVSPDLVAGLSYRIVKDGRAFLLMPEPGAPQFPNIVQVMPGPAHKAKFYFKLPVADKTQTQGTLLCTLGKAGVTMDAGVVGAVPEGQWAFWGNGEFSPVRADRTDKDGWSVVLMPMRGEKVDLTPPIAPEPMTAETVAEDVARVNALLAGPTVPGSKEIDPAHTPDPVEDGALAGPDVVAAILRAEVTGEPLDPEVSKAAKAEVMAAPVAPCNAYLAALAAAKGGAQ